MRVLWLCNIMLPAIGEALGLESSNREGWLSGIYDRLAGAGEYTGVRLGICFPMQEIPEQIKERCQGGPGFSFGNAMAYPFRENLRQPELYETSLEEQLRRIVEDFRPDLVHVFGTEFPHALAMAKVFERPERILAGIQGLCFACAEIYMADLPSKVIHRKTFRDRIRRDSTVQQQEKFRIRGEREKEFLKQVTHVTGRTAFDRRETQKINPGIRYHFMNETMREVFYTGCWKDQDCIPNSIFLSQGDYPLKGFHYLLQALPRIIKKYPDTCVYVAGNSVVEQKTWKDRLKLSSYGKYLLELMERHGLQRHVKILGRLSPEEMKEWMLKSSVFVCPSALENSSNSMAEAMLLGVPVVCSRTGGIPSLLEEGVEGLLVAPGDVEGLAKAVMEVWENPEEAAERAEAGRRRAELLYDGERNYQRLMEIYREICV